MTLVHKLKNLGDDASWQEFYDTYAPLIFGVARKAGLTDAEAQDALQDVMISAAKDLPGFNYDPARGSFKSWLMIKTRWKITAQFRKRGPLVRVLVCSEKPAGKTSLLSRIPDPATNVTEALWEAEWKQNALDAAWARLRLKVDPLKLQVFDCYALKGWPAEKVAKYFELSAAEIHLIKHRVKQLLQAEIKRVLRGQTKKSGPAKTALTRRAQLASMRTSTKTPSSVSARTR